MEQGEVVGRAHGDDRGEFLLLLESGAAPLADSLTNPLQIEVTVFASMNPTEPDANDIYWGLPIEDVGAAASAEAVAAGETLPSAYQSTPASQRIVPFQLGRVLSSTDGIVDFEF